MPSSPSGTLVLVLGLGLAAPAVAKEEPVPLEKRTYKDAGGKTLPYRLLKPEAYDPAQKYPFVLFLHGAGERGADNEKQLVHGVAEFTSAEHRQKYPCFLLAPQCPEDQKWADWLAKKQPPELSEPLRLALGAVDEVQKEFRIDPKRLYVTGLSMGGFGTWELITRFPDKFAAAVPVCGGGDETLAEKIVDLPVWAFHGGRDLIVPPQRSRRMVQALWRHGGDPGYTEYPGEGHASWVPAYRDRELFKWLFAQKRE